MRKQGWEARLISYIEKTSNKKFKWGKCDCLIVVCNAAKIVCDVDPMSKAKPGDPDTIRGAYATREEAYALIKKHRRSLPNIMDIHFKRINPYFAQRGDIVMKKLENGKTFGLVYGGKALFKLENEGYLVVDISQKMLAWRVE